MNILELFQDLEIRNLRTSAKEDMKYLNLPMKMRSYFVTGVALASAVGIYYYASAYIKEDPFRATLIEKGVSPGMTFIYSDHKEDLAWLDTKAEEIKTALASVYNEMNAGNGNYTAEAFADDYYSKKLDPETIAKIDKLLDDSKALQTLKMYAVLQKIYQDENPEITLNGNRYMVPQIVEKLKKVKYQKDFKERIEAPAEAFLAKYGFDSSFKSAAVEAIKTMIQGLNGRTMGVIKNLPSFEENKKNLLTLAMQGDTYTFQLRTKEYGEKEKALKELQDKARVLTGKKDRFEINKKQFNTELEKLKTLALPYKSQKVNAAYLTIDANDLMNALYDIRRELEKEKQDTYKLKRKAVEARQVALQKQKKNISSAQGIISYLPQNPEMFEANEKDLEDAIKQIKGEK